jgi:hypothetical protein
MIIVKKFLILFVLSLFCFILCFFVALQPNIVNKQTGPSNLVALPPNIENTQTGPSNSIALPPNIVIDKQPGPVGPGFFYSSDYPNDAACIQAALDAAKSGDQIIIRDGDYYITKCIKQYNKNLNIIGEGKVTLHLQNTDSVFGLLFEGSRITNQQLSKSSYKGSSKITLINASQVRPGYLIRIWNNHRWCPLIYPDQMTGETYLVKSVAGNTVTLNEPLIRNYNLSDSSQVEVYNPIEVHFKNIRLEDYRPTDSRMGLTCRYCINSTVNNCYFNASGLSNLNFYTSYNMSIHDNEIYNAVKPGSGYGVAIWSGSAYAYIYNNYIKNCRHDITSNEDDYLTLNRELYVYNNTLIGGSLTGAEVVDAHACTLDYHIYNNDIYPQSGHFAATDASYFFEFYNNTVHGGDNFGGGVLGRGNIDGTTRLIENNTLYDSSYIYAARGSGIGDTLTIENNTQYNGLSGVTSYNGYNTSFTNIVIENNHFVNMSDYGIRYRFSTDINSLKIRNNKIENIPNTGYAGILLEGKGFTYNSVIVQNNNLINVFCPKIIIKDIPKAIISENNIIENNTGLVLFAVFRRLQHRDMHL